MKYFLWACLLGGFSAASLPLGSWFGLRFSFTQKQLSFLAAFGAGALLAALSVELIAPHTLMLADGKGEFSSFIMLMVGCVVGGLLYILLDNLVNRKGGFLRRRSTLLNFYKKMKLAEQEELLEKLSHYQLFENFPPDHIEYLMSKLEPENFEDGEVLFREGDKAIHAYVLVEGALAGYINRELVMEVQPEMLIINLLPMVLGTDNFATAVANGDVKTYRLDKEAFDTLMELSPSFRAKCHQLTKERIQNYEELLDQKHAQMVDWAEDAKKALIGDVEMPSMPEIQRIKEEHHGSPLAIWLGILLDGIPESMVIGAGMFAMVTAKVALNPELTFGEIIPYTLIAGLFLSNFPEALSSSAHMQEQGWKKRKILLMWISLMVITAVGAGVGFLAAEVIDHQWIAFLEGLASGAMLTMIAASMIPEAALSASGNLVGFSTLTGFIAAVMFKLLE